MGFINWIKGVFKRMFSAETIESVLQVKPSISTEMKEAIELWNDMYQDKSPWLNDGENRLRSMGLASMIASEKARTATLEMKVKITGDSERAEFYKKTFKLVTDTIRKNLEYGIALGGFVLKPYVVKGVDNKYTVKFSYTKATDFYPLTFSPDGMVTEAAFIERIISKEKTFSKVEYHKLTGTTLTVSNKAYVITNNQQQSQIISGSDNYLGTEIPLTQVPEWSNLTPVVNIANIDFLLFSYFKMPDANTIDEHSPLGVSGFARAVSVIEDTDKLYSNLLWEFEGGQLAIDVDRTAFNPVIDEKGNIRHVLPQYQNRLFRHNLDLGEDDTYNVFNPNFRDASLINGLNNNLMHIEDIVALSRGTLSEVKYAEARTATELKILKQRTYSENHEIQTELQRVFEEQFKILDKYCDLYGIVSQGEYEVSYTWDDSILVDKDTERQADLLDIDKGLMSKLEYRMKWYGETEEQAQEMLDQIQTEILDDMEKQQDVMFKYSQQNDSPTNEKADAQNKKEKANQSGEIKK